MKVLPLCKWELISISKYPEWFGPPWRFKPRAKLKIGIDEEGDPVTWFIPEDVYKGLLNYELYFTFTEEEGITIYNFNDQELVIP